MPLAVGSLQSQQSSFRHGVCRTPAVFHFLTEASSFVSIGGPASRGVVAMAAASISAAVLQAAHLAATSERPWMTMRKETEHPQSPASC